MVRLSIVKPRRPAIVVVIRAPLSEVDAQRRRRIDGWIDYFGDRALPRRRPGIDDLPPLGPDR